MLQMRFAAQTTLPPAPAAWGERLPRDKPPVTSPGQAGQASRDHVGRVSVPAESVTAMT